MLERGPVKAGVVARELGLTSGSITALLDRLEQRGVAQRPTIDARSRST